MKITINHHMFPYVSICFHMFPYVSMVKIPKVSKFTSPSVTPRPAARGRGESTELVRCGATSPSHFGGLWHCFNHINTYMYVMYITHICIYIYIYVCICI